MANSSALHSTGSHPISQPIVTPPYPVTHSQVPYSRPSGSSQSGSGISSVPASSPVQSSGSAISGTHPYSTGSNTQTGHPRSGGLPTNASVTIRSSAGIMSNSTRTALSSHTIGTGRVNETGTLPIVHPRPTGGSLVLTSNSSLTPAHTANTTVFKPSLAASETKNATGTLEQSLQFSSAVAAPVAGSAPISNATTINGWSLTTANLTTSSILNSNSSKRRH